MREHILAVITAILLLALATVAMAADPFVGTWKQISAKVIPGPAPKSVTIKIVQKGDSFKWTMDFVPEDGNVLHMEWSGKFDGKDYPVTGDPDSDSYAFKKIDSNTIEEVFKKAGKAVGNIKSVISKSGKTLTQTGKYKDAKGQESTVTAVFDKQ